MPNSAAPVCCKESSRILNISDTQSKEVKDCHFLGTSGEQSVFYFEDCQANYSTCPLDQHHLWVDNQFSKVKVNNYKTTVDVDGKELKVVYCSAPCNGVKMCPVEGCNYIVPVKDQRSCRNHPDVLLCKEHGSVTVSSSVSIHLPS